MINFLIEYIYSLMYVIGLTFIISLVIPNVRKQNTVKLMISAIIYAIVVNIVTYPATRRKECRLRLCVMKDLSYYELDRAADLIIAKGREYEII